MYFQGKYSEKFSGDYIPLKCVIKLQTRNGFHIFPSNPIVQHSG